LFYQRIGKVSVNKLLQLGLQSQSLNIIKKYLPEPKLDIELSRLIFDYSLEHQKIKNIEYIFANCDLCDFDWVDDNLLDNLNLLNLTGSILERKIAYFGSKKPESNSLDDVPDIESFELDNWDAEEFSPPVKTDDSAIIYIIKEQNLLLSKSVITDNSPSFLSNIEITLPVYVKPKQTFSKFIIENKELLSGLYSEVSLDKNYSESNIIGILQFYFGRNLTDDLVNAISLSFRNADRLDDLKFEQAYVQSHQFISASFEEWLHLLDSFLLNSKKPILRNPLLFSYYSDIGKKECDPLDKKTEADLIEEIQQITYELVSSEKPTFLAETIETKSESFDFKMCIFTNGEDFSGYSELEVVELIEQSIVNKELFLKPVAISDFYLLNSNKLVRNKAKRLRELIYKFQVANLRLVLSQAKKFMRWDPHSFFDLIQIGNLSLLSAIDRFDSKRGNKFSTYAMWWIKQAMHRYIADNQGVVRVPVHYYEMINRKFSYWCERNLIDPATYKFTQKDIDELCIELDCEKKELQSFFLRAVIRVQMSEQYEPIYETSYLKDEEDKQLVSFIMNRGVLNEKESNILDLRFGLSSGDSKTLEEVGTYYNVTRERIRQIEAKALRKLKKHLRILDDFRDQILVDSDEKENEDES
jgi:RNA polymerase sigma factor (sigma-70 family)